MSRSGDDGFVAGQLVDGEPLRPERSDLITMHDGGASEACGMAGDSNRTLKVVVAFAAVYLVWGSTYLAIRFAVDTLPPFLMAGVRFVLAGSILYLIMRGRAGQPIGLGHWLRAGLVGSLMLLGGNGLVCWAEQSVPSGVTSLIVSTVPLWLIGLDWLLCKGNRPGILVVAGVAVGLFGVFLLVNPQAEPGERVHMTSALALLGACGLWSLGSLYSRREDLPSNSFLSASMQMLTGGCALLAVGTIVGEWPQVDLAAMSARSIVSLVYLILIGSLVGLTAYIWLLKNCSSAAVSTYAFVNPIVAVALGALWAGEPFTARHAIAGVAIVGSVALITLRGRRT